MKLFEQESIGTKFKQVEACRLNLKALRDIIYLTHNQLNALVSNKLLQPG